MKKNNILAFILIILSSTFVSCGKDFLNKVPTDQITIDNFYQSPEQLRQGTAGLYNVCWFQYNDKAAIGLGDALGGNILGPWTTNLSAFYQFNITPLNGDLANAWKAFYRVVAQSNFTIYNIKTKSKNVTEAQKNAAIAEARFMRASAYFYLVRLWGPVMIIENNMDLLTDPKAPLNPTEDVYKFIIKDLTYSIKYLPATDVPGRVTKFAAEGMLAKVYLTYSGYGKSGMRDQAMLDSAKTLAGDVCKNSGLSLYPDYAGLFKMQNNNNPETLFALEWVPLGSWGSQNTWQAYYAYSGDITLVGDGWGGGCGPSYDLISEYAKDPLDTLRRNATVFMQGNKYPEILQKAGGLTFALPNPKIKKYIIGTPDDNGGKIASMNASVNTYILRLSDVYLIYAEAILGNNTSTTDADALLYFNKVRDRAKVATKTSITPLDIFHERRVEFGLEAQLWYDIVRWYYYQPTEALAYINSQNRGGAFTWTRKPVAPAAQLVLTPITTPYVADASKIFLPYPENDAIANPWLTKAPVPYNFGTAE